MITGPACDKQGAPRSEPLPSAGRVVADSTASNPGPTNGQAGKDVAQKDRPHLDPGCFDVYAECPATSGLPAISADGRQVAVPDLGPEDARDEFVLTMRVLDVDTGQELSHAALLTHEDRQRWADPDTGELAEAFRPELDRRVRTFEESLARGRFGPLLSLGTVHEQRSSDTIAGMRASFDGVELAIREVDDSSSTGASKPGGTAAAAAAGIVTWRRTISRTPPRSVAGDQQCGPTPVADIALWVSREHRVALARVAHMSSEDCDPGPYYLVSRLWSAR